MAVCSEALADQSLEPVAIDGAAGLLARDGQTEPGRTMVQARTGGDDEIAIREAGLVREDALELGTREQAGSPRKALIPSATGRSLRLVTQKAG